MKKKLIATLTGLVMVMTGLASAASYPTIPVVVDGQNIGQALLIQNRAMLPVRDLEKIGAIVDWNNANKTAMVTLGNSQLALSRDSQDIAIVNGASYAKLRPLTALGIGLDYQADTRQVVVTTSDTIGLPSPAPTDQLPPVGLDPNQVFVREPLPATSPNPTPDYRDDVLAGRVEFSIDQASDNRVGQYWLDGSLPLLRIKAAHVPTKGESSRKVATREVMAEFARILRLSPNSDEQNIPVNLRGNKSSSDYILWAKLGKVGMFNHLVKADGTVDMNAPMAMLDLSRALHYYYTQYMGVDLNAVQAHAMEGKPIHPADLQKLSAEDVKILLELKRIGVVNNNLPANNFDSPCRVDFGEVTGQRFYMVMKLDICLP